MERPKGIDPIIISEKTIKFDKELKESEADAIYKLTTKEFAWANSSLHGLTAKEFCIVLCNKQKHLDQHCVLPVQCRIRSMTMSLRLQRDSLAKPERYEQDTNE